MVSRLGYATLEPPCYPTSLFDLKCETTITLATDDDTPHFGARYHPGMAMPHLRAPCAGFPMGQSRMDVLVVAVFIVVKYFLLIICGVPTPVTRKWPIPSTPRPEALHCITPWTLCAVRCEANISGQVWVCTRGRHLQWLAIFPALCAVEVLYPTRKASYLSGSEYLRNALPEPQQTIHLLEAHGQGYV